MVAGDGAPPAQTGTRMAMALLERIFSSAKASGREAGKASAKRSAGSPADSPAGSSVDTLAHQPPRLPEKAPAGSPTRMPAGAPANLSWSLCEIERDSIRFLYQPHPEGPYLIRTGGWSNEDFAEAFLDWIVESCPGSAERWLCAADVKLDLLPRFKLEFECPNLRFGGLTRGLAKVTKKREKAWTDWTGRRRTTTEYLVPKPAKTETALVDPARAQARATLAPSRPASSDAPRPTDSDRREHGVGDRDSHSRTWRSGRTQVWCAWTRTARTLRSAPIWPCGRPRRSLHRAARLAPPSRAARMGPEPGNSVTRAACPAAQLPPQR